MADGDSTTKVDVLTDLDITGKPAQFGRGVMVDVGNKLLGQFADCLAGKLAESDEDNAAHVAEAASAAAAAEQAKTKPAAGAPAAGRRCRRGDRRDRAAAERRPRQRPRGAGERRR